MSLTEPKRTTVEVLGNGTPNGSGSCRTCGASIVWFRTARHERPIPFDPGVVVLSFTTQTPRTARVYGTPHFVTCPDADAHRRRRTGSTHA